MGRGGFFRDASQRDSLAVATLGGCASGSSGRLMREADAAVQTGSLYGASVSAYQAGALLTVTTGHSNVTSVTGAFDLYHLPTNSPFTIFNCIAR